MLSAGPIILCDCVSVAMHALNHLLTDYFAIYCQWDVRIKLTNGTLSCMFLQDLQERMSTSGSKQANSVEIPAATQPSSHWQGGIDWPEDLTLVDSSQLINVLDDQQYVLPIESQQVVRFSKFYQDEWQLGKTHLSDIGKSFIGICCLCIQQRFSFNVI